MIEQFWNVYISILSQNQSEIKEIEDRKLKTVNYAQGMQLYQNKLLQKCFSIFSAEATNRCITEQVFAEQFLIRCLLKTTSE